MKKHFVLISSFIYLHTGSVAASYSSATIQLRGVVPEVTSISTVSIKSNLDLRPGVQVHSAKIGQVQIKLNNEISGIYVSSSTQSGTPENADNKPYEFSKPFIVKVNSGCHSLTTSSSGIILGPTETNIATEKVTQLNELHSGQGGIIENCDLSASWSSSKITTTHQQQNPGPYSMYITVTLVSL